MSAADIGMIGLGVMGRNLALNIAGHGYAVAGYDTDPRKVSTWTAAASEGEVLVGTDSLPALAARLQKPRRCMLMVPAGKIVDQVIAALVPHLAAGDIIIDGGNSHFDDTTRRTRELRAKDLLYVGMGVSGGEEGALRGPSMMPGGSPEAWPHVKAIFQAMSAKVEDGTPCCNWVGPEGAGHFVKMVHNGIEYGDMQLISEAYFLMKAVLDMSPKEMSNVFAQWNEGELDSYLIEITSKILLQSDDESGGPLIDAILDTAGQKGTGKWTGITALDLGIPTPTIAEAVFARCVSALKQERVEAAEALEGPGGTFVGDRSAFIDAIRDALYASKICSYAQGFALIGAMSKGRGWNLNPGEIAMLWREGCIIRARFLGRIREAFNRDASLPNLLLDEYFKTAALRAQPGWRQVVSQAALLGVPVPAFGASLAYFDGYRTARLPANLLQAQRDFFGAHTYERVDRPRGEFFHTEWLSHA